MPEVIARIVSLLKRVRRYVVKQWRLDTAGVVLTPEEVSRLRDAGMGWTIRETTETTKGT